MDVIFDDNHVVMTDDTGLCDRDPGSDHVMDHVAKAATLVVEFDLRSAAWPTREVLPCLTGAADVPAAWCDNMDGRYDDIG